jgi:hypothetical protein
VTPPDYDVEGALVKCHLYAPASATAPAASGNGHA